MGNKTYMVVLVVMSWAAKALVDGKVTRSEIAELVGEIAKLYGAPIEIDWEK